ncbi:MAG: 5-formyltetrahydrofolate cyclo-ligase [Burkholderiaceae bacterium]|nr:5-formyltetrahydrofolate cyclo-ligase [Burkholderiaceae bacterium]
MSVSPDVRPDKLRSASSETKTSLRRTLLALRTSFDPSIRAAWDKGIAAHVQAHLQSLSVRTLGVYSPIRNEPELQSLYPALLSIGYRLSLPIVIGRQTPMRFAAWRPGDPMTEDAHGIAVPERKEWVPFPLALLVPCVGFTRQGFRLGYGGGYFDRTIAQCPDVHTIGIAYACLETDFDEGEHDIPLNCVITENGLVERGVR